MDVVIMKRFSTCIAGFLLAGVSLFAQVHEAHLGGGLPMYKVFGVAYQEGIESVGPAVNVGYKYLGTWTGGLQWYVGADFYGRTVRFEKPWYVGVNQSTANVGYVVNIPIGAGLRYNFNFSDKFAAYADFGLGLSIEPGSKKVKDGHGINYNLYDGSAMDETFEKMEYKKGLTVSNAFSGIATWIFMKDIPSTVSAYFTFELGTVFCKHWLLGISYANFGVVTVTRHQGISFANYSPGSQFPSDYGSMSNSGSGSLVLSSLSLRVGYLF